jgi:predicted RNase H-like HicB family nuclease
MTKERKPLSYYLSLRYPVTLVPEEEGGYTAVVPDLPGCVTVGETPEEAMAMAEDARRLWIEDAYERGEAIPLPATERAYSGRLLLRMPRSLHRRLAEDAAREGVSLNQYIVALLQERSMLARVLSAAGGQQEHARKPRSQPPQPPPASTTRTLRDLTSRPAG